MTGHAYGGITLNLFWSSAAPAPSRYVAKAMTSDPRRIDAIDPRFSLILDNWLPLTYVLNELNRSMELPDVCIICQGN
ncbi:MAG: hypothetical protein ACO1QB_02000 [Verrucomicrobiales bacterium]